ncbi:DivIVA domain-containing protein [Micromonospora auratinigra]|uniref:DivIVA domain-containing protein n=1 Tax=Micromonospora auratinigra TaxID=261654 RepID=A0A1A9A5K3_9ACTN|nr:DivIVA domain-containing protein [Micromonospora auratinigra]
MGQVLLLLVVALTVAAVVFGVTVLVSGRDPGLVAVEPDGRAVPLPGGRPLDESDVAGARFDTALRGYRMAQVDQALRRAAYDIGYKSELIGVLEAEVDALRAGRTEEAEALRRAREESAAGASTGTAPSTDAPVGGSTAEAGPAAEAGLAAAPAAAAVEDETLPGTGVGAAAPSPVAPAPGAVGPSLRPPTDPVSATEGPTDAGPPATPTDPTTADPAPADPVATGPAQADATGPAPASADATPPAPADAGRDEEGTRTRSAAVPSEPA